MIPKQRSRTPTKIAVVPLIEDQAAAVCYHTIIRRIYVRKWRLTSRELMMVMLDEDDHDDLVLVAGAGDSSQTPIVPIRGFAREKDSMAFPGHTACTAGVDICTR